MLKNKQRIAIVVNSSWNIINFRLGLIKFLILNGYEVFAIAPKDCHLDPILESGAKFLPLKKLFRKGANPYLDYQLYKELKGIYIEYQFDLVLQYTIKPVIYGSFASGEHKTINTITGLGYSFLSDGLINKIVKVLYKKSLSKANLNIFQNEDDQKLFIDLKLVKSNNSTIINGSGISSEHFVASALPKLTEGLNVLFVGRMLTDKGVNELLDAAKELNNMNINIHLVGEIDKENPAAIDSKLFQEKIKTNCVTYHGKTSDPRPFYEMAHIVILPSYREGLPRVILEAMTSGRPIIVTDVPGCRQTVEEGKNGWKIKVKSSQAIVNSLLKVSKMPLPELQKMGDNGKVIVSEKFEAKIIYQNYLDLIQKFI